jgi:hypothetical protein
LLLNSTSKQFPNGLANSSGLVRKNLMFHPYASIQGVFTEPLDGHNEPHKSILSQQLYETDTSRGFVRGCSFEISRGMGPVATALTWMSWGLVPWRADHHSAFRGLQDRVTSLYAICEDLPEEYNRVTLDPSLGKAADAGQASIFTQSFPVETELLQTLTVQCYYRDARVMQALNIDVRPPFPHGYIQEPNDFSLLEPVRKRGEIYSKVP